MNARDSRNQCDFWGGYAEVWVYETNIKIQQEKKNDVINVSHIQEKTYDFLFYFILLSNHLQPKGLISRWPHSWHPGPVPPVAGVLGFLKASSSRRS